MTQHRIVRQRSQKVWDAVRDAYLAGEPASSVARRFDVGESNLRHRAREQGWTRRAMMEAEDAEAEREAARIEGRADDVWPLSEPAPVSAYVSASGPAPFPTGAAPREPHAGAGAYPNSGPGHTPGPGPNSGSRVWSPPGPAAAPATAAPQVDPAEAAARGRNRAAALFAAGRSSEAIALLKAVEALERQPGGAAPVPEAQGWSRRPRDPTDPDGWVAMHEGTDGWSEEGWRHEAANPRSSPPDPDISLARDMMVEAENRQDLEEWWTGIEEHAEKLADRMMREPVSPCRMHGAFVLHWRARVLGPEAAAADYLYLKETGHGNDHHFPDGRLVPLDILHDERWGESRHLLRAMAGLAPFAPGQPKTSDHEYAEMRRTRAALWARTQERDAEEAAAAGAAEE